MRTRRTAYISGGSIRGYAKNRNATAKRRRKAPPFMPIPMSRTNKFVSVSTNRGLGFRSRSGSMTAMSKGYPTTTVSPTSDGTSNSYYKHTQRFNPKAKLTRRLGAIQYFNQVYSSRLTGTTGVQTYTSFNCGVSSDLNSMIVTIPSYNNTTDLILGRLTAETLITNTSEASVYVDLYECLPRYAFATGYNPGGSANTGIVDASGSTSSFASLGSVPTMSKQFTALWKITKKYRVELSQGRTHIHKAQYNMGQKWNQELYNVYGSGWYLSNFSKSLLIVASGQPINDQTTKTNVSTSSVALDMVRKERFEFYYNNPTNTKYTYGSVLPAITTEYLLDVGSGEPEVLNVA